MKKQKPTLKNILILLGGFLGGMLFLFVIGINDSQVVQNTQTALIIETQEKEQKIITEKPAEVQPSQIEENNIEEIIEIFYPVVKVVDGDTLTLNMDGQNQTLRLIGIDTPETVDPRKPVQCFGVEASAKAKEILTGQSVRIEKDPTQGDYDKYGRLLTYVFLEDGTNFNKMMIEQGFAYEYTYNLPYKYQTEFKLAEEIAKIEKRGLWADDTCGGDTIKTNEVPVIMPVLETTETPVKDDCNNNVYNCGDFKTHAEAQATYDYCGGVNNDIHKLDRDHDGKACESLP